MRSRVIISALQVGFLMSTSGSRLAAQEYATVAASPCQVPAVMATCSQQRQHESAGVGALAAGEAPAYLLAAVQLIQAPSTWREVYHQVEHCAGLAGDYDAIRWAVMEAPLNGPNGLTYAFTYGHRIVLVRDDMTYLRHEMLHHILEVSGWRPPPLRPGERYTISDLHPMPLFGLCTGEV